MLFFLYLLIIWSAFCIILSKNTVQSVLFLILVFLLCSLFFIYVGADFIGLIILIVYIGAISVLFLFIIMMLNLRLLEIYSTFSIYIPISIFLSFLLFFQISYYFFNTINFIQIDDLTLYFNWIFTNKIQMKLIGELLFNEYYFLFIGAAFLLLIAMIGAILLTLDYDNFGRIIKKVNYSEFTINWKN